MLTTVSTLVAALLAASAVPSGSALAPVGSGGCLDGLLAVPVSFVAFVANGVRSAREGPTTEGAERAPPTQAQLVSEMLTRAERLTSVQLRASVDASSPEGKVKGRVTVAARAPADLRLEVESFFDQPVGVLTTDGARFALYDLREGVFVEGPATAENLARLLPIPLEAREIVALLRGAAPVRRRGRDAPAVASGPAGWGAWVADSSARVDPRRASGWALTFERSSGRLTRAARYVHGALAFSAEWAPPRGGVVWPPAPGDDADATLRRSLKLAFPRRGITVRVNVKDAVAGESLPDGLFALDPPRGVERVILP